MLRFLLIFMMVFPFAASSQSVAEMREALQQEKVDTIRLDMMLGLGHHYRNMPNMPSAAADSAKYYYNKVIELSKQIGHTVGLLFGRYFLAGVYLNQANTDFAVALFDELPDNLQLAPAFMIGKYMLMRPGNFSYDLDSAAIYLIKARALAVKFKDTNLVKASDNFLGSVYLEAGDIDKAMEIAQASTNVYEKSKLITQVSYTYLARMGSDSADLAKAIEAATLALQLMDANHINEGKAEALFFIAKAHEEARHYSQATDYLALLEGDRKAEIQSALAGYHLSEQRPDSAAFYAMAALQRLQAKSSNYYRKYAEDVLQLVTRLKAENNSLAELNGFAKFDRLMVLAKEHQSGYPKFEPSENKLALSYLDQAETIAKESCGDSCIRKVVFERGRTYLLIDDTVQAKKCFDILLEHYHDDEKMQLNLLLDFASGLRRRQNSFETIVEAYTRAEAAAIKVGDIVRETLSTIERADYLSNFSPDSADRALAALGNKYPDEKNPYAMQMYKLRSQFHRARGDLSTALNFAMQSIRLNKLKHNNAELENLCFAVGNIYKDYGDIPASINWYNQSITLAKENKSTRNYYKVIQQLTRQMILQHKAAEALAMINTFLQASPPQGYYPQLSANMALADCYEALGDIDKAISHHLKHIENADKVLVDKEAYTEMQYAIGKLFYEKKQYKKAAYHLSRTLRHHPALVTAAIVKDASLLLFRIDSANRQYLPAIQHYSRYKNINDTLFNFASARKIHELEAQFETEKKDQELLLKEKDLLLKTREITLLTSEGLFRKSTLRKDSLLRAHLEAESQRKDLNLYMQTRNISRLTQQAELQSSRLQREALLHKVTYAGMGLLGIVLLLLLNSFMVKQRSNVRLEQKQQKIHQQNNSLQKLAAEKEWLLKEIHHRVKNNLQIVMSLLSSQSAYLRQSDALNAIRESQHRVQAISLIHKKLYQSDDMAVIYLPHYIHELMDCLEDYFGRNRQLTLHIDPIKLDVSTAVPVCLIFNEAVSASLQHASGRPVHILLEMQPENRVRLLVTDQRKNSLVHQEIAENESLGMNLIKTLTEELCGDLEVRSDQESYAIQLEFTNSSRHSIDNQYQAAAIYA